MILFCSLFLDQVAWRLQAREGGGKRVLHVEENLGTKL